jgi:hypothetical protein
MEPETIYRLAQVFVVGKEPTITYSPRETKQFETILGDYLEERGRILVVTGPSKSGKTVLLRKNVPDAIWLSGGQIADITQFWRQVVDQTGGFTGESKALSRSDAEAIEGGGSVAIKPGGIGVEAGGKQIDTTTDSSQHGVSVERDVQSVGRATLQETDEPLIIDDFHHMSPQLQREVVRQLKPLVDKNLAAIFAAVPHHAADAVMAENEMESRVESLQVGLWEVEELTEISTRGFKEALRVEIPDRLAAQLAGYSFRSPHLMQLLCRELAKFNDLRQTATASQTVRGPDNWNAFLEEIAVRHTDDQVYIDLVRGPQSRKDRIERTLKGGGATTDIYGAVMAAIRSTGPAEQIPYNVLRDAMRELLSDLPQKEQTTNTLKHMSTIAYAHALDEFKRLKRDPVLEWQPDKDTLFIADPFFSFRVRFGPQIL